MENKKEEFEQASDERLLDDLMKNKRRKRARKITLYVCLGILLLLLLLCVGVFCYIRWLSGQFSYDNGESQSFNESADDEAMDMTKPDAPAPPELPPYEIIENWFDGEKIAQGRGGKGLKNYNITPKTGIVAGCRVVAETDDVMVIENGGVIIRIPASSINIYKRDVQGVIVMRIEEGNQVVSLERVEAIEEEAE